MQKLWHVLPVAGKILDAKDSKEVDVIGEGWTIKQMVSTGPDGGVLLLVEKEDEIAIKQRPPGGGGQRPFGG